MKKSIPLKALLSEARGQWPLLFPPGFLTNILLVARKLSEDWGRTAVRT